MFIDSFAKGKANWNKRKHNTGNVTATAIVTIKKNIKTDGRKPDNISSPAKEVESSCNALKPVTADNSKRSAAAKKISGSTRKAENKYNTLVKYDTLKGSSNSSKEQRVATGVGHGITPPSNEKNKKKVANITNKHGNIVVNTSEDMVNRDNVRNGGGATDGCPNKNKTCKKKSKSRKKKLNGEKDGTQNQQIPEEKKQDVDTNKR